MKILLVSLNNETKPYPVFPLGLAYVAAAVPPGHDVRTVDLCVEEDLGSLADPLFRPDLVGISVRNVDNLTFPLSESYVPFLKKVVEALKAATPSARIVLGGSGYSLFPEELLGYLGLALGIVGEGEEAFAWIIGHLEDGRLHEAPSLAWIARDGSFRQNPPNFHRPFRGRPDRSLFSTGHYLVEGGMANVQTKRGCRYKCIYCTYPAIDGSTIRLREPADIVDEIEGLVLEAGVEYLYFVDDIFNEPPAHAEDVCGEILRRGLSVRWTGFVNPTKLSRDLLSKMKAAGCEGIELGTDTGSPAVMRTMRKSFSVESVRRAADDCRSLGLPFCHYLIFGGPGETRETFMETVRLMEETDPTAVIAMIGPRIYPMTELEAIARREGVVGEGDSLLFPRFYVSPAMGAEWALDFLRDYCRAHRNWVVPGLEINTGREVTRALRSRYRAAGPLWSRLRK